MSTHESLWTVDDIADYLGVARSSVNRWREHPEFPTPIRLSARAIRWEPDEVRAWARSQREGAARPHRAGRPPKPVTI